MTRTDHVAITGIGMVASLGLDATSNCAAARAGIVRASQFEDFPVRSLADGETAGVTAHVALLATRGFEGPARLLRLIQLGLRDLKAQVNPGEWGPLRAGFYLSLPDPMRIFQGLDWIADEGTRTERVARAAEAAKERRNPMAEADALLRKAARLAGWPGIPALRFVVHEGRTGVAAALARASAELADGTVDLAIVGGADSLLDQDTLSWLADCGRLKTVNSPVGLQPGEGAAFLLLEGEPSVRKRSVTPLGWVGPIRVGREGRPWASGQMPAGDGLAAVLRGSGADDGAPLWLIVDHSGESYSASDWGFTVARLRQPGAGPALLWYPSASFGETDAAFGAIATCVALRAFARGYAAAGRAVVASGGLGPDRAAFTIGAPSAAVSGYAFRSAHGPL